MRSAFDLEGELGEHAPSRRARGTANDSLLHGGADVATRMPGTTRLGSQLTPAALAHVCGQFRVIVQFGYVQRCLTWGARATYSPRVGLRGTRARALHHAALRCARTTSPQARCAREDVD
ncbi:hypothetical protein DB32_001182 [Sandaracinus amylolyticus]|uniref:Uncharacterized protein n=1 Tax=Sandaracinus amylolyticus TaxID=927083 RepID=A0A0F6W0B4_9BACT|nr:hypothetical protein DB32_001182 [Sandaracinus amylolyticus]